MNKKKYLNFLKEDSSDFDEIVIKLRDPEHQMIKFLMAARSAANPGHSFPVKLDPDDSEYSKEFYFDGDGSFYVKDIKFNGEDWKEK